MKAIVAVLFVVAAANAGLIASPLTTVVRAPSLDSAVIKSDRIGGNFAYSVSEAHAHIVNTPVIQHVATPVAVSYSAPAITSHVVAAPVAVAKTVVAAPAVATHQVVAAPVARAVVAHPHVLAAPAIHTLGTPAATVRIA